MQGNRPVLSRVSPRLWIALHRTALAVIFAWSAYTRFHLPPWPLADPDTWGYLNPALSKLTGGPFQHTDGRNFIYPGFLFLILATTKNFAVITIVQHLLGLATGGLILGCWRKLGRTLKWVTPRSHALLGLAVVAAYLMSNRPVLFEHQLRPEAITPVFAILNIFLTLEFLELRYRQPPSGKAAILGAAILANSLLLAMLKTSFALTILFAIVPVLISLGDRRETWRRRLLVLGVGVIVALAILVPENKLSQSDPGAHSFLPESLFTVHANLIAAQMDEDLARGDCGERGCGWLRAVDMSLHEEMKKSWGLRQSYHSFGFDPDFLMYHPESLPSWRGRFFDGDSEKQLQFYSSYYQRTLRHHPSWILDKIWVQMRLFYTSRNPSINATKFLRLGELYVKTVKCLTAYEKYRSRIAQYPPAVLYLQQSNGLFGSQAVIKQEMLIRTANGILSQCYLLLFCMAVTAAFVVLLMRTLREVYEKLALMILLLYSYNLGNCLGISIVHSLHVQRYSLAQYSFTLLSECAGLLFLLEIGMHFARKRKTPGTETPANAS